jgi:aspartyl-tRNA(Asn)/glutamyl-tRNA(Gln) amidotransferase subunit A
VTGSDRLRDSLEHLHAAQEQLNACILIAEEAAARPGGRLANMTVAVKDIIDQKGLPTTCGSGFYRQVPSASAPVIDRLEDEGAVILARTGLHEFAYGFSSENHWFGPIRNPWDPATSPGGSSGGSAVAVAAGLVEGALGTDTGGSIRVPAAMTGIFGLKVTHGRIPTKGVFPLAPSLDTVGPFARDMSTLSLLYGALSATEAGPLPTTIEGLRVVVPRTWVEGASVEPVVRTAFDETIAALRTLGAEVSQLDLSDMVPWGKIQELAGAEAAHVHREFRAAGEPYGPEVDARLTVAEAVSAAEYLEAQAWRAHLIEAVSEAFSSADVLATPAIAQRRKVIGEEKIGDQHYRPVLSWFSALVNHSGNPAIALPLKGMEPGNGPPPSIQLVAPWWQENLLIGVSSVLEGHGVVGFTPPPIFYGQA